MVWLIVYIIGVLFVGMVSVWFLKETDEDVTLLDLVKLVFLTLVSWLAVLLFVLTVVCVRIVKWMNSLIIKKGNKKEDEE